MRELVLGTAGHVDHGKTSLVRALTGVDTDRLKEEKARGITIELGFAHLDLPCGHRLGIVDVPGHERFVRNMVAGAAGVDLVAFVIAADEGVMPQTREHFEICRLLGIRKGLVVLTKTDLVEPEWLEMVREDIGDFFRDTFLESAPMVEFSAVDNSGRDQVVAAIDRLVADSDFFAATGPFRLPVDRIFSIKGFGAVVTGTAISGRIAVTDEIVIYPEGKKGRIRGIQFHSRSVEAAEAGHRTAINIQGMDKEEIHRGEVLATAGCLLPSWLLDVEMNYLSANTKPIKNRTRVRLHLGTAEIMARVILLDRDELFPGDTADVQLNLETRAAVWPGDHFVIRRYSPVTTIGGGVVLNSLPPKRRRYKEINQGTFAVYRSENRLEFAIQHLRESGRRGVGFHELEVRCAVFGRRLEKLIDPAVAARKIIVVEPDSRRMIAVEVYEDLQVRLLDLIADFHAKNPVKQGAGREELRSRLLGEGEQRLFNRLCNELEKGGKIVSDGALVRLPRFKVALNRDDTAIRDEIIAAYGEAGLKVPTINEVVARIDAGRDEIMGLVGILIDDRVLVKVSVDLYFSAAAIASLREDLVAHINKHGDIDAQGFKGLTGLSRKFSIPLLEYFDREKITLRVGDKRVLRGGGS